jgi:hypothetical protein
MNDIDERVRQIFGRAPQDADEATVYDQAKRCLRGEHSPEQVQVMQDIQLIDERLNRPVWVWRCEACGEPLYEVPDPVKVGDIIRVEGHWPNTLGKRFRVTRIDPTYHVTAVDRDGRARTFPQSFCVVDPKATKPR